MLLEIDALIGQYGSDAMSMYALQAMAPTLSIWHQPRASRGRATVRAISAPRLLPIPRPMRNTPRMIENVYVLAPNSRLSSRVQITSAASAQKPESAMATNTTAASMPGATPAVADPADWTAADPGERDAIASPSSPTAALKPTATIVAVVMS